MLCKIIKIIISQISRFTHILFIKTSHLTFVFSKIIKHNKYISFNNVKNIHSNNIQHPFLLCLQINTISCSPPVCKGIPLQT